MLVPAVGVVLVVGVVAEVVAGEEEGEDSEEDEEGEGVVGEDFRWMFSQLVFERRLESNLFS